jgi:electron transport complex protein RnfB
MVGLLALAGVVAIVMLLGYLLEKLSSTNSSRESEVVEAINELLPQTQCAQCGFPGCKPYAEAIANKGAPINLCPPGGDNTIKDIAELLDRPLIPLAPGLHPTQPPQVAVIKEAECIGCVLCIQACPVDAIVGASKFTHTVIAADCTGCELCIAPCPVDCIEMVPLPQTLAEWRTPKPVL